MSQHIGLSKEDYAIIGGGLLIAILGGFARQLGLISESLIQLVTVIVLFTAPVSIYSGKKMWGGEMAKNMEIVAIGLIAVILSRLPALIFGSEFVKLLGISSAFWAGFFNFLGTVGFAIVSYGFYRFWKIAQVKI